MSPEKTTSSTRAASRARVENGTDFVNGLCRTIKSVALYRSGHPLAVEGLRDAYALFERLLALGAGDRVSLTTQDERWFVDGARINETPQSRETLKSVFVRHGLRRIDFLAGLHPYELSALCELGAAAASSGDEREFDDFLAQKGVRHVLADGGETPRVPEPVARPVAHAPEPAPPAPRPKAAPEPPPAPEPAPRAAAPAPAGAPRGFGDMLRELVESSVRDPQRRAEIYKDALTLVKDALERQVDAATAELRAEKKRVVVEQARTEKVLATVADGKVVVDKDGRILMMNAAAEEIAGKRLVDLAGKHISESVDPETRMVAVSPDIEPPQDGVLSNDIRVIAQEEVERALKRSLALVHDDQGRVVGTYAVMPDVAKFNEARKMQEEFLSRVTHDLKAPLASISCGLELLTSRLAPGLSKEENNLLSICLRNSQQLARMIAEILDFSKMEAGRFSVHPETVPLEPILQEAVEALGPWAKTKGVALSADLDDGGTTVLADSGRVVHVLTNLLSNAIKWTPEGGAVCVAARRGEGDKAGFALISVRDTGCGIPREQMERVFEKFVQLDGVERRDGVGLGLTIVRELVKLHGGRVWVDSEVGRGTAFSFTLPLAPGR